MNRSIAISVMIAAASVITSCARNYPSINSGPRSAAAHLSAKEAADAMAEKKALDHCARYGRRGYEKVSSNSGRAPASSKDITCKTVEAGCPGRPQRTCLEYRCYRDSAEWTAKLAFRCK